MPKSIGKRHAIFIQNLVDAGDTPENEIKAYRAAYPNCRSDSTARKNSHRLRQNADISRAIADGLAARQAIIAEVRKKEIEKLAADRFLSQAEVDATLCDIIAGRAITQYKRPLFNPYERVFQTVTIDQPPTLGERIAAIDKYNRRHGGYLKQSEDDKNPDRILVPGEDDDGNPL